MELTGTHRVLWISRHTMTKEQMADLERVMGGPVELMRWTDTVDDVRALRPLVEQADAVAAVLPVEKMEDLLEIADGRPVLLAKSGRIPTGRWMPQPNGATEREFAFRHLGWQQILQIRLRIRTL